jgi:hypothetical protein
MATKIMNEGWGCIQLSDKIDYRGQLMPVLSGTIDSGKEAALEDDMTPYPQFKRNLPDIWRKTDLSL